MTSFSYALLLISLSIISLVAILGVWLLDLFATRTIHKIFTLRIGLILLAISPLVAGVLAAFSTPAAVFEFTNSTFSMSVEEIASWQGMSEGLDYVWVLSFAHITIFSILTFRIAYAYFSTKKYLKNSRRMLICGHQVWLNKSLTAPLSFGVPGKIYAPEGIEQSLGKRKTALALAHEKAHVANLDMLWKLISLIVQSFLFFAPWAYVFHKKFMLEIETFCDEIARENTQSDLREYGSFLLAMAAGKSPNFICTNLTDSTLKKRIIAMKRSTTYRPALTAILCSTLIFLSGLAIAGPLSLSNDMTISSEVFFDGNLVSSPVLITKINHPARIDLGDKEGKKVFSMSVVPSIWSEGQIKLSFTIEETGSFKAQPYIVVRPEQKGIINIKTDSGKILELRTVASHKARQRKPHA